MDEKELISISGQVDTVKYENEENGYTILTVVTDEGDEVTVTGYIPLAAVGERLEMKGQWFVHSTYGKQFKVTSARRGVPQGKDAIYDFLASSTIKGIGAKTAALIVSRFSDDSLNVIENHPELLTAIQGITAQKARGISEEYKSRMGIRRLLDFMNRYDVNTELALKIYKCYGEESVEMLCENPYILSSDQIGADFQDADELAVKLGFEADDPVRISAATVYELIHNQTNGHCFIPEEKLVAVTVQLIGADVDAVSEGLEVLCDVGDIVREDIAGVRACYLRRLYEAEMYTAKRLIELAAQRGELPNNIEQIAGELENELGISYDPLQKKALSIAARERVMVITGGPGTGKTTIVRAILEMYDRLGIESALAAPTGRAAKRMSELCSREALTIHRLLEAEFSPEGDYAAFRKNEDDKLKCGAVILDECSMIDIMLMKSLLCALPAYCRLVLVGDADQLPAVGPGNVFRDIIRSGEIPVVRLTEVFRQAQESRIVLNAHLINRGEHPNLFENKGDFFMLRRYDPEQVTDTVISLCRDRLPKNMGFDISDIQVLCPTRMYENGTTELNLRLQQALNPPAKDKPELKLGSRVFRLGDRVMQIRNNYDLECKNSLGQAVGLGVFNGDVGFISSVDGAARLISVNFDGRIVEYNSETLLELEHAYAMTVHKAQGSEYRAVVIPVGKVPASLISRGVLYTAITRAKELLVLVGDDGTVNRMIDNYKRAGRYSGLKARLEMLGGGEQE